MADQNIFREVDEELRTDRMRAFWRRFGPAIIVAAVAVVLVVAGNEGWRWWSGSNAAKSSDDLYAAIQLADAGKIEEAQKALTALKASGSGAYPMLAQFKQAGLLAREGKIDEAVAAYDALASGQSNSDIRSLALVLAANLMVDKGDVGGVETRVGGLLATDNPLRVSAREALGLVNYKAGKLEEALKQFQAVINDPTTPDDMRGRMGIYLAQLAAEGVEPPAPATPEPKAGAAHPDAAAEAPDAGGSAAEAPSAAGSGAEQAPAAPDSAPADGQ